MNFMFEWQHRQPKLTMRVTRGTILCQNGSEHKGFVWESRL